jgi:superfamily II DNA/RNA helicase
LKGITEELGFSVPSGIQGYAIPIITKTDSEGDFVSLIAQSKNGSGKTGAFTIGSVLRVDPKLPKT